ncbi:MAG: alanine--tRNA ligase [bacterium]|nr:alanine--tRNA ligase [bacterium]
MTAKDLKQKYLDFFVQKGHKILPNTSLVPEHDPTALFISAGMHPLVPYLLGEPHPLGKRLVSVQRCLRTGDIDEVGDSVHHTFFEMLGNWSLGDYFKKEAIEYSFEFLTSKDWLGLPLEKLAVSVFAGDTDAPFDQESYDAWLGLGINPTRIAKLPKKNNWWGPVGETGPCGPDTEMFFWTGQGEAPKNFDTENPSWVEIWNDVFMEYEKKSDGTYLPLKQKNVDTGMGVERTLAVFNGVNDDYETDIFKEVMIALQSLSGRSYEGDAKKPMRIIADHVRAATFLIGDDIEPSNKDRGYVLRRLIRRAIRYGQVLGINQTFLSDLAEKLMEFYKEEYPHLQKKCNEIKNQIRLEEIRFKDALQKGLGELKKVRIIDGKVAFDLYQTYGFPLEMTEEIAREQGQEIDEKLFKKEFEKHQELSRTASVGMFKGGLGEQSEMATKYHTATHLLNAVLRQVLGTHVSQKGSNITAERLRFDFPNPVKLTPEQLQAVEGLVNQKIEENLPVIMEVMTLDEAKEKGAQAVFAEKYGEKIKLYTIGNFSVEVCGGPHVDFTGRLGKFKIIKEETAGAGVRRIYAVLENK